MMPHNACSRTNPRPRCGLGLVADARCYPYEVTGLRMVNDRKESEDAAEVARNECLFSGENDPRAIRAPPVILVQNTYSSMSDRI